MLPQALGFEPFIHGVPSNRVKDMLICQRSNPPI
jgi:hypothetical protein